MRVVVFGAHGGVGRRVVQVAAGVGHQVVAAARTVTATPPQVVPAVVDVRDAEAVRRAVEGADALCWCVGVTRRSGPGVGAEALWHVVAAAQEFGVSRLVSVSGAGVTLPSDVKGVGARLVSGVTRRLAADLVADKEAEHRILAATSLAWTEVRPPRLVDPDTAKPENWVLVQRAPGLTAKPVAKVDVARAMLHLAASADWVRQSPFLVAL